MPVARKPIPTTIPVPTTSGTRTLAPSRPRRPSLPPSQEMLFWSATTPDVDPHDVEDIFAVMPRTGVSRRLTDDDVSDRDPDWAPGRRSIVSMRGDAVSTFLAIRNTAGVLRRTIHVVAFQPVWMDRSRILACVPGAGDRTDIACIDLSGVVHAVTAAGPGQSLMSPAWHPTAGLLATLGMTTGSTLQLVHMTAAAVTMAITTGTPIPVTAMTPLATTGGSNSSGSAWSPDGLQVAYITVRPCATSVTGLPVDQLDIAILDLATGHVRTITDDSAGTYEDGLNDDSPVFSPDGKWLAWCRGYEDGYAAIMLERLADPTSRRVLVPAANRYRAGLSW